MVGVAQSAEHRVVAPAVEGSSPFTHPIHTISDFGMQIADLTRTASAANPKSKIQNTIMRP